MSGGITGTAGALALSEHPTTKETDTMRLLRLTLRNFKGARATELVAPAGGDVAVYGDNASGKTTLADAWFWLLFGKDSTGSADFAVKTLDAAGEPLHGLEHSVEAELQLADGARRVLTKTLRELWVKKRGAAVREFSGHTTDYALDGVPLQKTEFDREVARLCAGSEAAFRLLTDPLEFAERLHWTDRRKLLLEVCGDIPDSELLAADAQFEALAAALDGRTVADYRKVLDARLREINLELEKIPVRIDEAARAKPPLPAGDRESLTAALEADQKRMEELDDERAQLVGSGASTAAFAEERRLKSTITESREAREQEKRTRDREARQAEAETVQASREAGNALSAHQRATATAAAEIEGLRARVEARRAEFDRIAESPVKVAPTADSCPACGQALPADQVAAAVAKAQAAANLQRANQLEGISAEGKALKVRLDQLEAAQASRAEQEEKLASAADVAAEAVRVAAAKAAQLLVLPPPPPSMAELALLEELAKVEAEVAGEKSANAGALERIAAERAALAASADGLRRSLSAIDANERADARIAELGAQEKELAQEHGRLQHLRWLIEEFTRARVRRIEERVNAKFRLARFQLFRELINGGLEECCEVTCGGVPYSSGLNHGARVAVGLDIITTLQDHYQAAPPVFIDQCESLTRLPGMNCQTVRLVVSSTDPELRFAAA